MSKFNSLFQRAMVPVLFVAGTFILVPAAYATSKGMTDWRTTYPNSNSDDAGCTLCHGSSTGQLNAYGKDLCVLFNGTVPSDWGDSLVAIENVDSDLDPNAFVNVLEIANDTQPGWTTAVNPLYRAELPCDLVADDSTVPSNVPLPYDPVVSGDPIANPGGPYEALVGEVVTFDGSGSIDEDPGTIVAYDWDFGDGNVGSGEMPTHTYFDAGNYNVTLTVTDDDDNVNSAQTTATISDPELLDLDIAKFSVTKGTRVGKDVTIKLVVENNGTVLGQAIATVVGEQDGDEIYNRRLNVFDDIGKGTTTFKFQSYTAEASGDIEWTATIADGDPDIDEAAAVTTVK